MRKCTGREVRRFTNQKVGPLAAFFILEELARTSASLVKVDFWHQADIAWGSPHVCF